MITLEFKYKEGWGNIAYKIARFIHEPRKELSTQVPKLKRLDVSYKEACSSSRWTATSKVVVKPRDNNIKIGESL